MSQCKYQLDIYGPQQKLNDGIRILKSKKNDHSA